MRREHNINDLYTPLEYIESTGTQYIDSEFKLNNNSRVVIDYTITKLQSNFSHAISPFGARAGFQNTSFMAMSPVNSQRNVYYTFANSTSSRYVTVLNKEIHIDANKNIWNCTIGGAQYNHTFSNSSFQTAGNCYIFKCNFYNECPPYGIDVENGRMRLTRCQIYDNGILIRDYIPKLRVTDNKPGLYDLCGSICPLTGTPFYINAGTGEFSYA